MHSFRSIGAVVAALVLLIAGSADPASAQGVRIAAVVNDEVISLADFNAREALVLASSNIPDSPDTRDRISSQVLRQLIDEKLELQETKKEGVKVTDDDVNRQLAEIARSNHQDPSGLDQFLAQHNVNKDTLTGQIRAQISWARLVQGRYGHTVTVGEDEVSDTIKQIEADQTKPQNHVAEIFLSVDNPQQDQEVHSLADRLVEEIQHGAPFPLVARQFSQSPTAAVGGDIGWVIPGMLDPSVQGIINQMEPGTMTKPVQMAGGYYIYMLVERRKPESEGEGVLVNLSQVVFPMAENADAATRQATIDKARAITTDARSCGEIAKLGRTISPDLSGPIGDIQVTELPAEIRQMILTADIARPTDPVPVRGGIGVFMVCARQGGGGKLDRDQIESNLRSARLENISRRYLADLRRVAYVDLRV